MTAVTVVQALIGTSCYKQNQSYARIRLITAIHMWGNCESQNAGTWNGTWNGSKMPRAPEIRSTP